MLKTTKWSQKGLLWWKYFFHKEMQKKNEKEDQWIIVYYKNKIFTHFSKQNEPFFLCSSTNLKKKLISSLSVDITLLLTQFSSSRTFFKWYWHFKTSLKSNIFIRTHFFLQLFLENFWIFFENFVRICVV